MSRRWTLEWMTWFCLALLGIVAEAAAASVLADPRTTLSKTRVDVRWYELARRSELNEQSEASGMPWKRAIGFLAAVGMVLVCMVLLGLLLQCTNRPRMEARHPISAPSGSYPANRTARSMRRGSQMPRPLSQRAQLGSSPSQVGLLDQVQPQPVTSRRARNEAKRARQLPAPPQHLLNSEAAPYSEIKMPPAVHNQGLPLEEYQDYTTITPQKHAGSSRKARPLPLPQPDFGTPLMDMTAPYADSPSLQTYHETSPFESHEVLTQSSEKPTPRSSRGYVPLPEPPMQMTQYNTSSSYMLPDTAYYDTPTYHQEMLNYVEPNQVLRHNNSQRSRRSGLERNNSQLSRVESIGAGDHRRHSRRLPQPPGSRMTTAERLKALRSVTDDMYTDDTSEPVSRRHPANAQPTDTSELYVNDSAQYPVREELRYATQYQPNQPRPKMVATALDSRKRRYNPL
ncbi:hypothetical protein MYAM1_003374 [Malassezia yamatoensis]|uniref:Uncharacterized protein n=1 Tax=Malassezia yamatoensis TaxID=253288 RepID=A0AAJ5YVM4_9BASI|nr:hypothetical protein MYAM1_003374 [Malassezia yamatoensis]